MTVTTYDIKGNKYAVYVGIYELIFDTDLQKFILHGSDGHIHCSIQEVKLEMSY